MADAIALQIKDTVITRLKTISVANGYRVDVGEVSRVYKRHDKLSNYPALQVVFNDRRTTVTKFACKEAQLTIVVEAKAKGSNAEDIAANLQADVEQCLESQTDNEWLGGLLNVTIKDIISEFDQPIELPGEIARGVFTWATQFRITYQYRRGSP